MFQQLLIDLFKFLAPFLRNAELAKQTHLLYKVGRDSCRASILLKLFLFFFFFKKVYYHGWFVTENLNTEQFYKLII